MSERNRDKVLACLKGCNNFEDVKKAGILFHGTCEHLEGDLKGGGYDGVFWTAASPDIAQAYIPRSGVSTWIHQPADYERDDRISPSRYGGWLMDWALEKAGVSIEDLDVTWNGMSAVSWSIPDAWPTEGDLDDHIKSLGYEADGMGIYTVSLSYEGVNEEGKSREVIMPADWKLQGQLIIILAEDLEVREPEWSEDGLGYHPHNRVVDFAGFASNGIEAFNMGDNLQSDLQGNVPHQSIGILPAGLEKLSWIAIPATRHDGESTSVWHGAETAEFADFIKGINPDYKTAHEIEKASRLYAVMTDSHRPGDNRILARGAPSRSKEEGFWIEDNPEDVWLMDHDTAVEVVSKLAYNSPRIVRAKKAIDIIRKQREAKIDRSMEMPEP